MSALAAEIERDRIAEAVERIGRFILTEDAPVSFNNAEGTMVECQGRRCQRALCIKYSHGVDELVKRLATDGWQVMADDTLICPKDSGANPDYWRDQVD